MKKPILGLLVTHLLVTCTSAFASAPGRSPSTEKGWAAPIVSPDASRMLFAKASGKGLYLAQTGGQGVIRISDSPSTGYRANWSFDSRFAAFKRLVETRDGQYLQAPTLFDVRRERFVELHQPVSQAGVPTTSRNGLAAFTIGQTLLVTDTTGRVKRQFNLGSYANLAPISPNGGWVIYNDDHDQLRLLDLRDGSRVQVTGEPHGCFEPQWSPTRFEIAVKTLDGELVVIDLASHRQHDLGQAAHATWSPDGEWLIFSRVDAIECVRVNNIDLWAVRRDGSSLQQVTFTVVWEDYPQISRNGQSLTYVDRRNGTIVRARLNRQANTWSVLNPQEIQIDLSHLRVVYSDEESLPSAVAIEQAQSFDVPYIHQVYDVPDWFNGHWACGATSAVMCLAYYSILPPWPVMASRPYQHISQFGRYVCEKYSFNGYTYDIGSPDPDGRLGYGGYGFITRNDWRDTKGYMAQYARQHGLSSSVDWYPSRSKVIQEIDKQMPFVLLNDLTDAGHYVAVSGYTEGATTLVVNDPYGNKNRGYWNYGGKKVSYDWPGYNNGHSNLRTVHCFIYMRGSRPDLAAQIDAGADSVTIGDSLSVSGIIVNIGTVPADTFRASVVLSQDPRVDASDYLLGEFEIPGLMAHDTARVSASVRIPDSLTSNLYALALLADADSEEIEFSEDNNLSYDKIIVRGYPDVFNMWPGDGSTTTKTQPTITVVYRDRACGVACEHVRFYFDSRDVTDSAEVKPTSLTYVPSEPLHLGEHILKVVVPNNLGYATRRAWTFTVQAPSMLKWPPEASTPQFRLSSNYPNPFNAATKIAYELARPATIELQIFSVDGREIRRLDSGYKNAGQHVVIWDGKDSKGREVASGLYLYRLLTDEFKDTRRMLLLR